MCTYLEEGEGMKDHTYKYESGALASPVTVTAPQPSLVRGSSDLRTRQDGDVKA